MSETELSTRVIEPIRKAFPALKASSWYFKIHPYFTRQPPNLVGEYIRHFCPKGGLVVDPFCGSGVTAIEALTNKCRTTCGDLDPLAVFITKQTCISPVNIQNYWEAYAQVEKEVNPITEFVRKASKKEIVDFKITEWYPKDIKLPSNADRAYLEDLFGKEQLISLAYLRAAVEKISDTNIRDLLLFTFSGILARASITYGIDAKHAGGGDSGIFKVFRYWVPPNPDYRDVWGLFATRARLVAHAKEQCNKLINGYYREGETFNIYCDSAENLLKYTGKNTVDYIYTDPPYGAHISYLDLSTITMWNAWLKFQVTDKDKAHEAIEGGEQKFDEKHYLNVLQSSFEQMFYALKDDAWLSLVFHHKETNLWYAIRDMLRYTGFTYVNTVAQPLSKQTFHKIQNPLRVLGESLIVNFQKSHSRKIFEPMSLPMANVIKNAAERTIVEGGGATTEEIMRAVVPELFEATLIVDAASKNMGDILAMLEQDFELSQDNLWHLKEGHKLGYFIPPKDRIYYYVISYLRKVGKASFDSIVTTVLPLLINGHRPSKEDIQDALKDVAVSYDGINWELKDPNALGVQGVLPLFVTDKGSEYQAEIPESTTHNQQIYRLAMLCDKAGFVPFIGKKEGNDPMFSSIKPLSDLNIKATTVQLKRIEQIDIVWASSAGIPVWAFEIEESTPILSALERFVALLSVVPDIGKERRLTIVAPKNRRRKVQQELTESSYIGHPQYMENKINYMFYDDLEEAFKKYSTRRTLNLDDLKQYCQEPSSLEDK